MKKKGGSILYQLFSLLILFLCFFGTIYYVRARKDQTMNIDEASELVLGNQLAKEGKIITKEWFYSTELRVLNTNIFYSFFFRLTNNWHRVWLFSNISMYILLLLIYGGMAYAYNFTKYAALSAAVLFIPFSVDYYDFMLRGAFYIPHITITFLILALSEVYLKISGWKSYCLLLFSFLISIIVGLGGARQLLILYIPLFISAFLLFIPNKKQTEQKKWLLFSINTFFGSIIGFLLNSQILSKTYHFKTWADTAFSLLKFSRVEQVLNSFITVFGYSPKNIFSFSLIRNSVGFLWIGLTVYAICYAFKNRQKISGEYLRFSTITVSVYIIFIFFYIFTDTGFDNRYSMPIIVLSFPLIALFLQNLNHDRKLFSTVFLLLVLGTAICGADFYKNSWKDDYHEELRKISKDLVSQGYINGYAYFWNANLLTAISNGQIDVWDYTENIHHPEKDNFFDVDRIMEWLQLVRHGYQHPEGKVFILCFTDEYENHDLRSNFNPEKIIYQSYDYVILGYDDYEDMIDNLYPGYDFSFDDNIWMENGEDENGHRKLYVGGVSYGPYKTFWPGNYSVTITGNGLEDAAVFCIADYGQQQFEIQVENHSNTEMIFTFEIKEKSYNFETIIRNLSDIPDSVVDLETVSIKRCPKGICMTE
ncbi:MAG: hypothetical protein IJI57_00445 [Flexilinea sp.]|nr:hypothetical protein [Flexilinea sp.]